MTTDIYIKVKVDKPKITKKDVYEAVKKDLEAKSLIWHTSLTPFFKHKYKRENYDE